MTIAQVIELEKDNRDKIYLFPVGGFYKAYEHSAFFFHTQVKAFKVSKRFVKSVNRDVVMLGFPISVTEKWLYGLNRVNLPSGLGADAGGAGLIPEGTDCVICEARRPFDELEFEHWRDLVELNASDRFTPNTSVIENAPVYRTAIEFLKGVYAVTPNLSKDAQTPLGVRLKTLSYEVAYAVRRMYDVPDRAALLDKAVADCDEIKFLLEILSDMRQISVKTYALCSERIVSVSKQLAALRTKVKA